MLSTGFSFGGLPSSGHSRCNVLDVKVERGRGEKDGKIFHSVSCQDTMKLGGHPKQPRPSFRFAPAENNPQPKASAPGPTLSALLPVRHPRIKARPGSQHGRFLLVYARRPPGLCIEETASKLLNVSSKAQERAQLRDEGYALITAQNAAESGKQKGKG
jgi:hypothetical protein